LQALVESPRATGGLADLGLRAALAAEVEDVLNWRESGLEVDAVDFKA
jgi:hypothetical protein